MDGETEERRDTHTLYFDIYILYSRNQIHVDHMTYDEQANSNLECLGTGTALLSLVGSS